MDVARVEAADKQQRQQLRKGGWQAHVKLPAASIMYGPQLPTASERLTWTEADSLEDIRRTFFPDPACLEEVLFYEQTCQPEGPSAKFQYSGRE